MSRRQQGRWAAQEQAQGEAQQQQQPAQSQQAPSAEDPVERLRELGELHQSGVLTDEEFAAAKAKVIG